MVYEKILEKKKKFKPIVCKLKHFRRVTVLSNTIRATWASVEFFVIIVRRHILRQSQRRYKKTDGHYKYYFVHLLNLKRSKWCEVWFSRILGARNLVRFPIKCVCSDQKKLDMFLEITGYSNFFFFSTKQTVLVCLYTIMSSRHWAPPMEQKSLVCARWLMYAHGHSSVSFQQCARGQSQSSERTRRKWSDRDDVWSNDYFRYYVCKCGPKS